ECRNCFGWDWIGRSVKHVGTTEPRILPLKGGCGTANIAIWNGSSTRRIQRLTRSMPGIREETGSWSELDLLRVRRLPKSSWERSRTSCTKVHLLVASTTARTIPKTETTTSKRSCTLERRPESGLCGCPAST